MLYPLFDLILGQDSNSQLSRMLNLPLEVIGAQNNVVIISLLFISIIIIKIICVLLTTYLSNKLCFDVRKYIMLKINDYYLSTAYKDIIKEKQGVLINNLVYEPQKITAAFLKVSELLIGLVMITFYYSLLLLTNFKVTLLFTGFSILVYLLNTRLSKEKAFNLGLKEIAINQEINVIGAESISALRQIKTFGIKDILTNRLKNNVEGLSLVELKKVLIQTFPRMIIELIFFSGITVAIVILYKTSFDLLKTLIPTLALFVIVSQRLVGQLNKVISSKIALDYHIPSVVLVKSLIEKSETVNIVSRGFEDFKSLKTDIIFSDVTFAYDGKSPVLTNVNISIPKGKVTAIVGESGIGKSTVADLILGLYFPQAGTIEFNGTTIQDVNILDWRKKIGFVSQDNFLFHTTIMENIRLGNLEASEEMVIDAAKKANAHEFITGFPEGYNTVVGDRGLLVSGGQKQRIAIARALIRFPEILIFDEATSALDRKTEEALQNDIFILSKDKTVVIISHRLETVRAADKILNIENGKIYEVQYEDIQDPKFDRYGAGLCDTHIIEEKAPPAQL